MNDFGGQLRQARERRGVSLRQIAASTKISAAALEALERNDISKLPGGIFSRAFVRSYAVEVGLDPDQTVREFLDRFQEEPAPADVAVVVPEDEIRFENRRRLASAVLTIVIVGTAVAGVILYLTLWRGARGSDPPPPVPQAIEPTAPPAALEPSTSQQPASTTGTTPQAAGFTLDLHPTGPCWISLTVDGERQFARVVEGGERISRTVLKSAVVEIGDAAVFAYSLDGRPGRSLGGPGEVKTARITPETFSGYLR
jgi:cytoskeletal protein RodZ